MAGNGGTFWEMTGSTKKMGNNGILYSTLQQSKKGTTLLIPSWMMGDTTPSRYAMGNSVQARRSASLFWGAWPSPGNANKGTTKFGSTPPGRTPPY